MKNSDSMKHAAAANPADEELSKTVRKHLFFSLFEKKNF